MWWQEAVTVLKGIGPKKAQELANLGVFTVGDLLEYYPRQEAYLDYGNLKKIKELAVDGSRQIFCATVYSVRSSFGAHGKRYTVVTVRDETAYASLYFFLSQRFSAQKLKPGMEILVMGRVRPGRTARTVSEVQVQPFDAQEQKKPEILPVYALSGNLTQSNLRHWMREALEKAEQDLPESLPVSVIEKCNCLLYTSDAADD